MGKCNTMLVNCALGYKPSIGWLKWKCTERLWSSSQNHWEGLRTRADALDHSPKHHHGICMAVPTITTLTAACCRGLQCNFPLSPGASDFTTATKRATTFCSNSKTNACDWLSQSHTLLEGWFQGNLESKHLLFSSSLGKLILILIKTHKAEISLHQI